jgi:hypothetical protein
MRALTKVATFVAATALVLTGMLSTVGIANAEARPAASNVSVSPVSLPGIGTVSLTGTVVKVEGEYLTIVLDASNRKVVVDVGELTDVLGKLKPGEKVKVVVSALEAVLGFVKALQISPLN